MQLQVECSPSSLASHSCLLCQQKFELAEARVIVCDSKGSRRGDVCPQCLSMGPSWIWKHILHHAQALSAIATCEQA